MTRSHGQHHHHRHHIHDPNRIFAPINTPLSRRLETFSTLFYLSSVPFFLSLIFVLIYQAIWGSNKFIRTFTRIFLVAYFAYYIQDFKRPFRGEVQANKTFLKVMSPWISRYKNYFPITAVITDECDKALRKLKDNPRPVIFGSHPHGIISIGTVINFALDRSWFEERFPYIKLNLLTLNMNVLWPLWRDWLLAYGFASVERSSCDRILSGTDKKKDGQSNGIVIVVGGAREALDAVPGKMDLTLNSRNGFFRLALRHGALLIPALSFGENDLFEQLQHPLLRKFQQLWNKTFGFSTPYFFGRGVFNYRFGWLPRRIPITTVIGPPIDVKKTEEPSEKEIAELRAKYIKVLEKLYSDYREKYEIVHNPNGLRVLQ
jgi:1-acyl-sn-glycerol-3-phosphate acyltransferase